MIIHFKKDSPLPQIESFATQSNGLCLQQNGKTIVITSSKIKEVPQELTNFVEQSFTMESDIQLAHKSYITNRTIHIGSIEIGNQSNTLIIGGPCSVESWEQIDTTASALKKLGIQVLRAGCFKPRTSPYTFQGLGKEGIDLLVNIRDKYDLKIVTEVKDSTHLELVLEHTDIVQIGTKAMYDTSILRRCGRSDKPILLKRGFGSTIQEFVQAAEFILSQGNPNVILCERGIRTFESKTRFTLDLTGVAYLKHHINLPVVVDPSHAMGYSYGVPDLARAATAMGVDGLLIETHPNPINALSDAAQQLNLEEFEQMYHSLIPVANAVGRTII